MPRTVDWAGCRLCALLLHLLHSTQRRQGGWRGVPAAAAAARLPPWHFGIRGRAVGLLALCRSSGLRLLHHKGRLYRPLGRLLLLLLLPLLLLLLLLVQRATLCRRARLALVPP